MYKWTVINSINLFYLSISLSSLAYIETAAVALWLERPPWVQEVVGSIRGRHRPKSKQLVVVVAFPIGDQDYGNSSKTGRPVSR